MLTVTAREMKTDTDRVLDFARKEPVVVKEDEAPSLVILSDATYEEMRRKNLEAFNSFCDYLGSRARKAGLTEEKLEELLSERDE